MSSSKQWTDKFKPEGAIPVETFNAIKNILLNREEDFTVESASKQAKLENKKITSQLKNRNEKFTTAFSNCFSIMNSWLVSEDKKYILPPTEWSGSTVTNRLVPGDNDNRLNTFLYNLAACAEAERDDQRFSCTHAFRIAELLDGGVKHGHNFKRFSRYFDNAIRGDDAGVSSPPSSSNNSPIALQQTVNTSGSSSSSSSSSIATVTTTGSDGKNAVDDGDRKVTTTGSSGNGFLADLLSPELRAQHKQASNEIK